MLPQKFLEMLHGNEHTGGVGGKRDGKVADRGNGTGVRLPDDIMSVEEVAAMLSDTKTRENQEKNKKRLPTGGFCDNLNALQDKCEEEEQ